jgi:hypothetical protein
MSRVAQDNSKKNIIVYSVFGVLLVGFAIYAYNAFSDGPAPARPAAVAAPVNEPAATVARSTSQTTSSGAGASAGAGAAPGIAATKMASTSSSLDPTLDETAMLRTESLVYTGTGRNIFSATYTPPPPPIPIAAASARPTAPVGPPPPPPPPPTCPPTCPPINLKYFGVALRANGTRQAFLLSGEDVYLASQDDIVARKYKIVAINANSIQVEDLTNHNTQTLPLLQN